MLYKIYSILLLILAFNVHLKAQSLIKYYSEEDDLLWADFQGLTPKQSDESKAKFYLGLKPEVQKRGDSVIYRVKAVGYFDKSLSYSFDKDKSAKKLRFFRNQFKLLELTRRQLQVIVDTLGYKANLDEVFRNVNAEYILLSNNFTSEYVIDNSSIVLDKWEARIDSLFNAFVFYEFPKSLVSPWSFGVNFGFCFFSSSKAADNILSPFGFTRGISLFYKKIGFQINIRSVELYNDVLNNTYNYLHQQDFLLGYRLLTKNHFEVYPLVGITRTSQSLNGVNAVNFTAGIALNVVHRRNFMFYKVPYKSLKVFTIPATELRFFVNPITFPDGIQTLLYSLSLGLTFRGGQIR